MKLLAWNCRGLNSKRAKQGLQEIIRTTRTDIIFLSETKLSVDQIEQLRIQTGFSNCVAVPSEGASGGLALLWYQGIQVDILSNSTRHIDFRIWDPDHDLTWRCTGFYGDPVLARRPESWNLLRELATQGTRPWLVIGDFNEIISDLEKEGGRRRSDAQMENFREALGDCQLEDIGYDGVDFTWEYGRSTANHIRERLDRGVATREWLETFEDFKLDHLLSPFSDHCPLLLDTLGNFWNHREQRPTRPFRFEQSWTREPECEAIIADVWATGDSCTGKLQQCQSRLHEWSRMKKQEDGRQKRILKRKIREMQDQTHSDQSLSDLDKACRDLEAIIQKEEEFWGTRAKENWLMYGDQNTKYFHQMATARHKINFIRGLKHSDGNWYTGWRDMEEIARRYYVHLFSAQPIQTHHSITSVIQPSITTADNEFLLRPFTEKEVRDAMFDIEKSSAPGPDGFSSGFYQTYWHIVGKQITQTCIQTINQTDFSSFNNTDIVLLPKVKSPQFISQYRPIALCNVFAKTITKMITNRLKVVIDKCIDECQAAFIPGRHITDNVLIAFELIHTLRRRRKKGKGTFALKLDMSKAYDRVEWPFIRSVMLAMGFHTDWVDLIMRCIQSPSYSIRINGKQGNSFTPTRGIRQGDPLSPLLYVICSEGFSTLMRKAMREGKLKGIGVLETSVKVNHLLFADDSFVFGESTIESANAIKDILQVYAACSGQQINFDKSTITFSPNTPRARRSQILNILGVQETDTPEKYLGLPTVIGRDRMAAFREILDKMRSKANQWTSRSLSKGGKEIFIKAILQAFPVYAMLCFPLPLTFGKDAHKIIARYWWDSKKDKNNISWLKWLDMCLPKSLGGLNFKDLPIFNRALLGKQSWKLLTNQDSILFRILKTKYFPHQDFLQAELGRNPSMTWRGIYTANQFIKQGIRWIVGNGRKIRIWEDAWLPHTDTGTPSSPKPRNSDLTWVCQLMQTNGNAWDMDTIRNNFNQEDIHQILSLPLSHNHHPDFLVWKFEESGTYSVKSAYKFLTQSGLANLIEAGINGLSDLVINDNEEANQDQPNENLLAEHANQVNTQGQEIEQQQQTRGENDRSTVQVGDGTQMNLQRQARQLGVSHQERRGPAMTTSQRYTLYKVIWKLNLPEKVIIFLWRMVRGFIQCRAVMRDHHVRDDAMCPRCANGPETLMHTFRWCWFADEVWKCLTPSTIIPHETISFLDWMEESLTDPLASKVKVFAITVYKIWYYRNQWVKEGKQVAPDRQAADILCYIQQLDAAKENRGPEKPRSLSSWNAPPLGILKLNFDACFFKNRGLGSCGGIVRGSEGEVLAAFASPIPHVATAMMAEALACRMAVFFARELKIPRIIFEGDNLRIISVMKSNEADISSTAPVLNDAKLTLTSFEVADFNHVYREANGTADALANYGLTIPNFQWYFDNYPIPL